LVSPQPNATLKIDSVICCVARRTDFYLAIVEAQQDTPAIGQCLFSKMVLKEVRTIEAGLNAVLGERFVLRACIVNFRTEADDVDAVLDVAAELGASLDADLRPASLGGAA